jgi:hypothetical protein
MRALFFILLSGVFFMVSCTKWKNPDITFKVHTDFYVDSMYASVGSPTGVSPWIGPMTSDQFEYTLEKCNIEPGSNYNIQVMYNGVENPGVIKVEMFKNNKLLVSKESDSTFLSQGMYQGEVFLFYTF